MSNRTFFYLAIALIVLTLFASLLAYPRLPERVASHWNAQGQVDGYMPKSTNVFVLPGMLVVLGLLFALIPAIDPLKANIKQFRGYYNGFVLATMAFLAYLHLITLGINLGLKVEMLQLMAPGFGALLFAAGLLLEHAQPNWFIGIRTPWTLSSLTVWAKTHQRGALLFKICGVIAALGVVAPGLAMWLLLVPLLGATLYLTVYSYLEYQAEQRA